MCVCGGGMKIFHLPGMPSLTLQLTSHNLHNNYLVSCCYARVMLVYLQIHLQHWPKITWWGDYVLTKSVKIITHSSQICQYPHVGTGEAGAERTLHSTSHQWRWHERSDFWPGSSRWDSFKKAIGNNPLHRKRSWQSKTRTITIALNRRKLQLIHFYDMFGGMKSRDAGQLPIFAQWSICNEQESPELIFISRNR